MKIEEIKDRIRLRMQDIKDELKGMPSYHKHNRYPHLVLELDTLEWVKDMLDNIDESLEEINTD